MTDLAFRAMQFARAAHKGQVRKYTGNPYIDHLAEVAGIVAAATSDHSCANGTEIAIAWLHDCMEDQGVSFDELKQKFGSIVAFGVADLSDLETGNRGVRNAKSRARLVAAPPWVQTIKCADLISNMSSIVEHDPKFAVIYLEEKRLLLEVLTKADPRLRDMAVTLAHQL